MLRSMLDIAFPSFGGALLISTINVLARVVSLAIGVLSALAHSATYEAPRPRRFSRPPRRGCVMHTEKRFEGNRVGGRVPIASVARIEPKPGSASVAP
jgi:hypothetical protein